MWPMTDAEAVLFIMTVALLVALAQVAGRWPPLLTPHRWFVSLRNGDFDYVLEQHKGPGRGDARDLWLRSSVGWSGARN